MPRSLIIYFKSHLKIGFSVPFQISLLLPICHKQVFVCWLTCSRPCSIFISLHVRITTEFTIYVVVYIC